MFCNICRTMEKVPENFGQRLKEMRETYQASAHEKPGISIRELARQCGMHFTMIADYEAGRRFPSRKSLEKLAGALGVLGEDADEFISSGRRDARMSKTKQDFPMIPATVQKRLLEEISKALQLRGGGEIRQIYDHPDCDLMWVTDKEDWFAVEISSVCGRSEKEALHRLSRKLESKGKKVREGGKGSKE